MQNEEQLIKDYLISIPTLPNDQLADHYKIAATRNARHYVKVMEAILKELRSRRKPITKEEPCESTL